MGSRSLVAALGVLAVVACTDSAETSTTSPQTAGDTTAASAPSVDSHGRLAIIDDSGDIVVTGPDGSDRVAITNDAGETALYTQPVWSPDGSSLSWGQATSSGFAVGIGRPDARSEPAHVATSNLPFYTYWSPDGTNLGVLHNGSTGVAFQMIDVAGGTSSNLDEDAPFYFSWSPSSDRVVTHAGESRAETITPGGERVALQPTAGTYLAPQWTEAGVFHVVDDHLVLENEDGDRAPVAQVAGLTMFVANSDGSRVALQTTGDGSTITAAAEEVPTVISEAVVVIDVVSGENEIVDSGLALGFFWSPDGESLLVLTTAENEIVPVVWTSDGGEASFAAYRPQPSMLEDTFPFFPQYAQSVNFWAPDSSAFAFAGALAEQVGIWVQHLDAADPVRISDGVWVAWSSHRP